MKKYFFTGLVILLPLALTIAIAVFVFNLLTDPFVGGVKTLFAHLGLFTQGFLFLSAPEVQEIVGKAIVFLVLIGTTLLLGVLTRWFFIHTLISFSDMLFSKIPFVRSIYKTSQDVVKTVFSTTTSSFKQVVLAKFPNDTTYTIGLVTQESVAPLTEYDSTRVAVFIPTTPNPTSGFLILFKKEDLIYLDMKIEDALKYVISCGVLFTPLNEKGPL